MASERILSIRFVGDASNLNAAAGKADGAVAGLGVNLGKLAKTGLFVGAAYEVGQFGRDAIAAASNLEETLTKTNTLFESNADEMEEWSGTAAESFGMSQRAALDAAADFAIFGQAADMSGEATAKFAQEQTQLAADFASFFNTSPEEAVIALGAAYRGESEPIRRYGILLNDAILKERARTLGIYEGSGALTSQQRIMAAHAEIMAQSSKTQGDFARTSEGLANQQRIFNAQMEETKAAVGQSLLPIMKQLVGVVSGISGAFNGLDSNTQSTIVTMGLLTGAGLAAVKMLGSMKTAMAGAGAAGPWIMGIAAAAAAATAVIGMFADKETAAERATKEMTASIRDSAAQLSLQELAFDEAAVAAGEYADAVFESVEAAMRENIASNKHYVETLNAAGISMDDMTAASHDAAKAQEVLTKLQQFGNQTGRDQNVVAAGILDLTAEQILAYHDMVAILQDAATATTETTASQVALARSGDLTAIAFLKASNQLHLLGPDAMEAAERALELAAANEEVAETSDEATTAEYNLKEMMKQRAAAAKEAEDRAKDLVDATRGLIDGEIAGRQASADFAQALLDMATAVDDPKTAVNELVEAQDRAALAALAMADANVRTAEQQALLKGTTLSAAQALQTQIGTLYTLALSLDPSNPLRVQLLDMIADLQTLQGQDPNIVVTAETETANTRVGDFRTKFENAVKPVALVVEADTDEAVGNVQELQTGVDNLPSSVSVPMYVPVDSAIYNLERLRIKLLQVQATARATAAVVANVAD